MFLKKLQKLIKRHPFLYLTRFRLLSRNSNIDEIKNLSYNELNDQVDMPDYFKEINSQIFKNGKPDSDLEIVLQISTWLKRNIKGGPGLSEPSGMALKTMLSGKGGVCSDMAQIFNNFCVINDIKVREWGTTCIPFNKRYGGHSFNEFYSKELQKWVLIDVYWGFLFYDLQNKPLSVIEFFTLKRADEKLKYQSFIPQTVKSGTIHKNYLNDGITPFLICDYKNRVYDSFLSFTRPYLPVFVIHFLIYLLQKSYHYRFPIDNYKGIFSRM